MRTAIFILIILLSFSSCQEEEKPKDLIPKEKMVEVILELTILHGAKSYNRTLMEQMGIAPEDYLWEKFNIDSMQFVHSNAYYSKNYEIYEDIYQEVKDRLEAKRTRYDTLLAIQERKIKKNEVKKSVDTLSSGLEKDSIRGSLFLFPTIRSKPPLPYPILERDTI